MYRNTQTLPGGALTLLGILALSFLMPGWIASALGLSAAHAALFAWITRHDGLFCIALFLIYGLTGFAMLVGGGIALYAGHLLLLRGLAIVKTWGAQISVKIAVLLGELLYWPARIVAELVWDRLQKHGAELDQLILEQRALRRLYRDEYAGQYPSYRAFLRDWRVLNGGQTETDSRADQSAQQDPVQQAIRLMGLPEPFTSDELKRRFRTLIDRIHPDKVGPNELATQLIAAYALLNQRKAWK